MVIKIHGLSMRKGAKFLFTKRIISEDQNHITFWGRQRDFMALTGMMMIAYLLGETGVFQWMAVKAVRLGKKGLSR